MAVVALKSDLITKMDATPVPTMASSRNNGGYIEGAVGWASKAADDSATSTYRMVRVHSSWRLTGLLVTCGALGTSGALNAGLYETPANGGAAVAGEIFASALAAATAIKSDLVADAANGDDLAEQVWQRAGLSADPNKHYDIVVELDHAGAGNAVKIGCQVQYQR